MNNPLHDSRVRRDAARLAVQSAAAGAGALLAMRSVDLPEEFLGVLSAVLVVQPSVGNTIGAGRDRVVATLVGSGLGLACLAAVPGGLGTAAVLAVVLLVINGIAGLQPEWRYGVVAAIALALGSGEDLWQTAQDRGLAIVVGSLIGIAVSFVVWPDTAKARFGRHMRSALESIDKRLDAAVASATEEDHDGGEDARKQFHEEIDGARQAAAGLVYTDAAPYQRKIEAVIGLYNSVLFVNRVAEETSDATAGSAELDQAVCAIRETACGMVRRIAEGDAERGRLEAGVNELRSTLQEARDVVARRRAADGQARAHVMANAMVFALGEVTDGLEALLELHEV